MAIKTLLIANRGEIAVRIIRAAKSLGIKTVQVYSEADEDMLAVKLADEAICIGPASAAQSYLNHDAIISAAKETGADAIHPGYGFLSENADFVRAVSNAGLIFVGPDADLIEKMGNKIAARQTAMKAGVAVVPGSDGAISDLDEAVRVANKIGYPVMIKAAAGGGGRGIRIADDEASLRRLAPQAQAEAAAAFGDGSYYLEYVVVNARHIEVQVMGDGKSAVHFFERECSLQRRRQKIWEEAPSATLDEATRQELCQSAVKLTQDIGYVGAGTVEYLYEESTRRFFFIEMNTRIQVEHPVTEAITGFDLVAEMIRIAGGAALSMSQDDIKINGHSIEVRINAENPMMQFLPSPGVITSLACTHAPEVRFDHFLYEGYAIPPFYDSLLGKLIVHGKNRGEAIAALHEALENTMISGIETTIPLLIALAKDDEVKAGQVHTSWLEHWLEHNIENIKPLKI